MEDFPGVMGPVEAHTGAMEVYPGTMKAHSGVPEALPRVVKVRLIAEPKMYTL
jgi:hypothetical protein